LAGKLEKPYKNFDDISLLRYPLDADPVPKLDAELDRMVAAAGKYGRRGSSV